jgi:hypothetical protein
MDVPTQKKKKKHGWVGTNGHSCKMLGSPTEPHVPTRNPSKDSNGFVASRMGLDRSACEPPLATKIPTKLAYIYFYAIDMALQNLRAKSSPPKASEDACIAP